MFRVIFSNLLNGPLPASWSTMGTLEELCVASALHMCPWRVVLPAVLPCAHAFHSCACIPLCMTPAAAARFHICHTPRNMAANQLTGGLPASWSSLALLSSL